MRKQSGFTLIELVVVIVILGILAVTAAPRFLNLQSDARASALQGMVGAMQGAASVVYAKSSLEGEEGDTGVAIDDGITTEYGYPSAEATGIVAAVTGLEDDSQWVYAVDGTTVVVTLTDQETTGTAPANITGSQCYITYSEATSATSAASAAITDESGC